MTLTEFLDYLARAIPELAHLEEPPADWLAFRRHCEHREEAGRAEFGDEYLRRDNAAEGLEEAADGLNYCHFAVERARHEGHEGHEVAKALQLAAIAGHHFYQAHQALAELQRPTD